MLLLLVSGSHEVNTNGAVVDIIAGVITTGACEVEVLDEVYEWETVEVE